jgi:hypothetical protein
MPQAQSGGSPEYRILETNSMIPSTVLNGYCKSAVEDSEHIGFAVSMGVLLPASYVSRLPKHVTLANLVRVCVTVMQYIQLYQRMYINCIELQFINNITPSLCFSYKSPSSGTPQYQAIYNIDTSISHMKVKQSHYGPGQTLRFRISDFTTFGT